MRHLWGLDSTRYLGLDRDWTPDLCALVGEHGVPDERIAEDVTLDVCPPRLQLKASGPSPAVRYVPYNGSDHGVGRVLAPPRRPRVCVTWGSTVEQLSGAGEFPAAAILRALSGHDVEVVVATSDDQVAALGPLPANVTATGWMPLRATLESCVAIVHEGGAGTAMTASLLGVPQLVVPALHEQMLVAEQLAAAGAGQHLPAESATEAAVDGHLGPLLDPGVHRPAASELRQHMLDQPTLADVVSQ